MDNKYTKSPDGEWRGKQRRDDTPSFIRNVQARSNLLNPNRNSEENIPVLAMPSSIRTWRKIRWPLFVFIVLGLLLAVGLITNDHLVDRSVSRRIEDASILESMATLNGLIEANEALLVLSEKHPSRLNAQAAYAWNCILMAQMFGNKDHHLSNAQKALTLIEFDNTSLAMSAKAGAKYLEDNLDAALQIANDGLQVSMLESRLQLVKAWVLNAQNKKIEAIDILKKLRKDNTDYLPALHFALDYTLKNGDLKKTAALKRELLSASPGNIFATLVGIDTILPAWNELKPSNEIISSLQNQIQTLLERIQSAPPNIKNYGTYITGRINLLTGDLDQAVINLKSIPRDEKYTDIGAWYAKVVRKTKGPAATLAVLNDSNDKLTPAQLSLKIECLLDRYHIDEAQITIDALDATGSKKMNASFLRWALAVRTGDLQQAGKLLPSKLSERHKWLTFEMYDLLRRAGDIDGIDAITERMEGSLSQCADVINQWHNAKTTFDEKDIFDSEDPCVSALSVLLMKGHMPLAELREAANRIIVAAPGELRLQVERALAIWLIDGRDAAVAALQKVQDEKPEGASLLLAMARGYLEMELYNKSLVLLEELDTPEATALKIEILKKTGKKTKAESLLKLARSDDQKKNHPAIAYLAIMQLLDREDFERVVALSDKILNSAGAWSSEIAELKARAQNALGTRIEADRGLLSVARKTRRTAGRSEAWQSKIAVIRINLRRGGNFLFKAVAIILEMYKSGVKDAELSYSYAVANIRQGNEKGASKYLREALDLNPSFLPAYNQLNLLGKLSEDNREVLNRVLPDKKI